MEERDPEQVPGHADGQARARVHAGAAPVRPADGHHRVTVAATPDQVDDLDVEHDAGDQLAREDVPSHLPAEALEPALRVLDRAHHPDGGQQVEGLAKRAAPARLGRCACRSRPAGSGSRRRRPRPAVPPPAAPARPVASPCPRPRTPPGPRAPPASRPGPPPPCRRGDRQQLQIARSQLRACAHQRDRAIRAAVVHHEDVDVGRKGLAPGRPSRPWSPRRCR